MSSTTTTTTTITEEFLDRELVIQGKSQVERTLVLHGSLSLRTSALSVLQGKVDFEKDRSIAISGKSFTDSLVSISGKPRVERALGLWGYVPPTKKAVYNFQQAEMGSFSVVSSREDITNKITINYGYHWTKGEYTKAVTKQDRYSIGLFDERLQVFDVSYLQGTRQVDGLVDRLLRSYAYPIWRASFTHNLDSYAIEPGDFVTITHPAGPSANGWDAQSGIVSRKRINLDGSIDYEVIVESGGAEGEAGLGIALYEVFPQLIRITATPDAVIDREMEEYAEEEGVEIEIIGEEEVDGIIYDVTLTVYVDLASPIPAPDVTVEVSGITRTTNINGQCVISLRRGQHQVRLSGPGYTPIYYTLVV